MGSGGKAEITRYGIVAEHQYCLRHQQGSLTLAAVPNRNRNSGGGIA